MPETALQRLCCDMSIQMVFSQCAEYEHVKETQCALKRRHIPSVSGWGKRSVRSKGTSQGPDYGRA